MKCVVAIALFASMSCACLAQSTASSEAPVLVVDQAWTAAEVAGDRETLDRILDDRFVATLGAGDPLDKAHYVSFIVDDFANATKSERVSDRVVRLSGDTAVVVETDSVGGVMHGKPYAYEARLTAVYIRRDGRWRALALHVTRKPRLPR